MKRIGIIGCGAISGIYFENLAKLDGVEVVACADLDLQRCSEVGVRYGVPSAKVEEILADPSVDMILNLTVPKAHHEVSLLALRSGKHVYSEKPLAIELHEGRELLEQAAERGLRIGCAPDTFLGAALQTCRKILDDGMIGDPIGANGFMLCHGHESWHPSPQFYYEFGGGPLYDMGPYYLTALVSLLGPASQVVGMAQTTFPTRTITSRPRNGEVIEVETPTHLVSTIRFDAGAVAQLTTSFDVWATELPCLEVYGTKGSLSVPDPNGFGGSVRVRREGETEWSEVPLVPGCAENGRGLGAWDMAQAIEEDRPHRASGEMAFHVLEIIAGTHRSEKEGRRVELTTRPERPAPL
ncbi:MAG: Gfo/Idh/MocA family oxidoreductase [Fimbriimonadaceae bacterium]|nr:Gfo/Idh/MocA family oxidoreductase [Chthonomonadaceae bacterium]MCO5296452.1 Gfo/Idh/MocA family oxidoreductase [Fimbriimonadaceae bacterium]